MDMYSYFILMMVKHSETLQIIDYIMVKQGFAVIIILINISSSIYMVI